MSEAIKETTLEVDGKKAKKKQHPPDPPPQQLPEFPPIVVPEGAYDKLQQLFNDGIFNTSKNTVRKDQPCDSDEMVGDVLVKCPNRATLQSADINECPECHTKKKQVKRKLCLPHSAIHWGANAPVTAQMELSDQPNHEHTHDGAQRIREAANAGT